jgi:hypothetical protein
MLLEAESRRLIFKDIQKKFACCIVPRDKVAEDLILANTLS